MINRVAFLSYHTCPLIPPGTGDAGGMNVYINELASMMVSQGVEVDVFTRRTGRADLGVVEAPGGYRVVHVTAGPYERLSKVASAPFLASFAKAVADFGGEYDLLHSHYWLSGWAGLLLKRRLGLPLANSFHTLGRVKDASRRSDEPPESLLRIGAEHDVMAGSDCVVASTPAEAEDLLDHYGADPTRLCISPPGVNHNLFTPGDQDRARLELGIPFDVPVVLYVGRVQPLKGIDVVVEAFVRIRQRHTNARLVIIGGPSGPLGGDELPAPVIVILQRIGGEDLVFRLSVLHQCLNPAVRGREHLDRCLFEPHRAPNVHDLARERSKTRHTHDRFDRTQPGQALAGARRPGAGHPPIDSQPLRLRSGSSEK